MILVPPSIPGGENVTHHTVVLGGTITLVCEATGDPPPTIVWMKNGTPMFDGDEEHVITNGGRQLTITGLKA